MDIASSIKKLFGINTPTARDELLSQVSQMIQHYFRATSAVEHDEGDYLRADFLKRKRTGAPIAVWTFEGKKHSSKPYTDTDEPAQLYFHIDVENNRAVIVHPARFLSGGGYLLNGATKTYRALWRS